MKKENWEIEFEKELENWLCKNKCGHCDCKWFKVKSFINTRFVDKKVLEETLEKMGVNKKPIDGWSVGYIIGYDQAVSDFKDNLL